MTPTSRIAPLEPPFDLEVEALLAKWMPPGSTVPPLVLFRTIARHAMLSERLRPLGAGLLARGILPTRVRELLILRTCARCDAGYEWGVHVTAYAQAAGLDDKTVHATATVTVAALATRSDEDAIVMRVADELHDTATLSAQLFEATQGLWGEIALLEMAAVVGFYHLISFMARTAGIPSEPWAAPFPEAAAR
jgi:hypothetical protein